MWGGHLIFALFETCAWDGIVQGDQNPRSRRSVIILIFFLRHRRDSKPEPLNSHSDFTTITLCSQLDYARSLFPLGTETLERSMASTAYPYLFTASWRILHLLTVRLWQGNQNCFLSKLAKGGDSKVSRRNQLSLELQSSVLTVDWLACKDSA